MERVQEKHPRCFIYGLVEPTSRLVFYVGQSSRGMVRPNQHRPKGWVFEIAILDVVDLPSSPCASMCPWLPANRNPTLLNELERYWIALGRALGWPLVNKTDGGDGMLVRSSPKTLAKMRASHVGKRHSDETRERIRNAIKARMADPRANKGAAVKGAWAMRKDLSGMVFGRWTVVAFAGHTTSGKALWQCRCECGVMRKRETTLLKTGANIGCGCMRYEDLSGRRFGKLTAVAVAGGGDDGRTRWLCKCDCGGEKVVRASLLKGGVTGSCGCMWPGR